MHKSDSLSYTNTPKKQYTGFCKSCFFSQKVCFPINWAVFNYGTGKNLIGSYARLIAVGIIETSPSIFSFDSTLLSRPARHDFQPRYLRPSAARVIEASASVQFSPFPFPLSAYSSSTTVIPAPPNCTCSS